MALCVRVVAAAMAILSGTALVAMEILGAPDTSKPASTGADKVKAEPWLEHAAAHRPLALQEPLYGSSFVQRGTSLGRLHGKDGGKRSGWIRAALGLVVALSASVSYLGIPGGLGQAASVGWPPVPGGPRERRSSSTESWNELSGDNCGKVGDLCVDAGRDAKSQVTDSLALPPGLSGHDRSIAAARPRRSDQLTKLGAIAEEPPVASRALPRRVLVPGRGDFDGLFRESRRAFQEADAELASEMLREKLLNTPEPAGVGVWQ